MIRWVQHTVFNFRESYNNETKICTGDKLASFITRWRTIDLNFGQSNELQVRSPKIFGNKIVSENKTDIDGKSVMVNYVVLETENEDIINEIKCKSVCVEIGIGLAFKALGKSLENFYRPDIPDIFAWSTKMIRYH